MPAELTARQKAVMELVCRGKTNAEIALIIGIGETTAKHHLEAACRKLGACSVEKERPPRGGL